MIDDARVAAILDERARELARPVEEPAPAPPVLVCLGRAGRWALPLVAVGRVDEVDGWAPIPHRPPAVLGLAEIGGHHLLLADLDSLIAGVPPRPPGRRGHVVALRGEPMAVVVDRAVAIAETPFPTPLQGGVARALADDGTVLLDPGALAAEILARGAR